MSEDEIVSGASPIAYKVENSVSRLDEVGVKTIAHIISCVVEVLVHCIASFNLCNVYESYFMHTLLLEDNLRYFYNYMSMT